MLSIHTCKYGVALTHPFMPLSTSAFPRLVVVISAYACGKTRAFFLGQSQASKKTSEAVSFALLRGEEGAWRGGHAILFFFIFYFYFFSLSLFLSLSLPCFHVVACPEFDEMEAHAACRTGTGLHVYLFHYPISLSEGGPVR